MPGRDAATMTLVIGSIGRSHEADGLSVETDHLNRVRMPEHFTAEDVARIATDYELLAKMMRERPSEMGDLLDAHCRRDHEESRRLASDLNLSEENFVAQGGGIIWGVVAAVVICDIVTSCVDGFVHPESYHH